MVKKISRFISFFIDLIIYGMLGGVLGFLTENINILTLIADYIFYIIAVLFLFRDSFTLKGSIGKKLMGLNIIDNSVSKDYFFLRKILRNVTNIVWPIEVLAILIVKKRISDLVLYLDVK